MSEPTFDPNKPFEEVEPSFDPNQPFEELDAAPRDSALENALEATAGAAGGASVGYAVPKAAEVTGKVLAGAVKKVSPYTPEQLEKMYQEYDAFKNVDPEQTLEKVRGQFIDKNRAANETLRSAYENLSEPLSRQEYQKAIIESVTPHVKDVPRTTPEFKQLVEENTPKISEPGDILIAQKQKQLADFADLKAKERVAGLKNASLGTMSEEALQSEYAKAKAQIMRNPEGFAFVPDLESAAKQLEQIELQKALGAKTAEQRAVEALQTPLAKDFPQLKGKMFSSSAPVDERSTQQMLNVYKYGDLATGKEAYEIDKNLRELAYTQGGEVKSDAAKGAAKSFRNAVGAKNPEASQKLEEMSRMISELTDLEKSGYLKRDKTVPKASDEFIKFGEKQQSQVLKDLAPNLYKSGVSISNDDANRLAILKKELPEELYNELELASLKQAMADPRKQLKLSPADTILAMFNPVAAAVGISTKGAKTAEGSLAAYRAMRGLQKLASKAAKPAAIAGGVVGGPIGAMAGEVVQEAFDAQESGPTQKMPEHWEQIGVRNPEEQKARAELSQFREEYGRTPKTIAQQFPSNMALEGMSDIVESPEITRKRELLEKRKQDILRDKNSAKQRDNYVEKFEDTEPQKLQDFINFLQGSQDSLSQEYSRVLSQVAGAPERERSAVLFSLNQNPAFREIAKKYKGG
jgi:hypothetical protein